MSIIKVKNNGAWEACGVGTIVGGSPTPTPPTPDGKVHLIVDFSNCPQNRLTARVNYQQSVDNGVEVNWGDGTVETFTGSSQVRDHTYTSNGRYDISLNVKSGTMTLDSAITGSTSVSDARYIYAIKEAYIHGVNSVGGLFYNNVCLEKVVFGEDVTTIGVGVCYYNRLLKSAYFPSGLTSIAAQAFAGCVSAAEYHFAGSVPPTLGANNVFSGIPNDCKIYVPSAAVDVYKAETSWYSYRSYIYGE